MSFDARAKEIIQSIVTSEYNKIIEVKLKALDARKIVPFIAKGKPWKSYLKYWISKSSSQIDFKAREDTTGNKIDVQLITNMEEIPRFPIDLEITYEMWQEYKNNKTDFIDFIQARIKAQMKEYNIFTNDWCLVGIQKYNLPGLVNDPYLTQVPLNCKLNSSSAQSIYNEINRFLGLMPINSKKAFAPNQLLVSMDIFLKITSLSMGANEQSIYNKLLEENPFLKKSTLIEEDRIMPLSELDKAGKNGTERMVCLADPEDGDNFCFSEEMKMVETINGFDLEKFKRRWENRAAGLLIDQSLSIMYGDMPKD